MKLGINFINAEDINSYEELTKEEKQIIPKEVFNLITNKDNGKSTSSNL